MRILLAILCYLPVLLTAQVATWTKVHQLEEGVDKYAYVPKVDQEDVWRINFQTVANNIEQQIPLLSEAKAQITLPLPSGKLSTFTLRETGTLSPELQLKYPEIRCLKGKSIDYPGHDVSVTISPYHGLHVYGSDEKGSYSITPYDKSLDQYISYYSRDIQEESQLICGNTKEHLLSEASQQVEGAEVTDGILRTYRFAVAATTQYSEYHYTAAGLENGTTEEKKAAVLAAMSAMMNNVNLIFNRDIAVHLELIPNNDDIIFIDSDQYSDTDFGDAATNNVSVLRNTIGNDNFDLGHVFTTLGGGVGAYDAVCNPWDELKANGSTGTEPPTGSTFLTLACHEIGHQFNGTHTQSSDACSFSDDESVEPGSGSTILSYASSCIPSVQDHSDEYFHASSISQMRAFALGAADVCATKTTTTNEEPTIAPLNDYTVPISTSLLLDAEVSDPEGDPLTYCWEQYDFKRMTFDSIQQPTTVIGPLIRSLDPTPASHRYLPNLETILAGEPWNRWEIIPSVSRSMKFKLTVRDNNAEVPQVQDADMEIRFTSTAGPFVITNHNSPITWQANTRQTITWDVANTDAGMVNTPEVVILFSSNRGETFDIVLADSTPNDGMHEITVPNISTTTGRIMVMGKDNIFLDINNADISIDQVSSTNPTEIDDRDLAIYPNPNDGNFTLSASLDAGKYQLKMYTAQGQLVVADRLNHTGGELSQRYAVSLPSGVYLLKVSGEGKHITKQVIIQ